MCAALLVIVPAANADWSEDFDSYALGSSVDGQGGWAGWGGDPGYDGYVTDTYAYSTPHSMAAIPTTDIVQSFSETSGEWEIIGWIYIPSGATGLQYFIMLNTYVPPTYNWSVQLEFDSDAGILEDYYSTTSTSIIFDSWTEVRLDIYLGANTYDIYYDDVFLASNAWQTAGVNEIAALDIFSSGGSNVYWDDFTLIEQGGALEQSTWGHIKTIMQ